MSCSVTPQMILGPELERAIDEAAEIRGRRLWAAMMLTADVFVFRSIVHGLPVRVGCLERQVLRRAFRGQPHPEEYVTLGAAQLDAVAEAGPLPAAGRRAA